MNSFLNLLTELDIRVFIVLTDLYSVLTFVRGQDTRNSVVASHV
jgi:hypothetical protein